MSVVGDYQKKFRYAMTKRGVVAEARMSFLASKISGLSAVEVVCGPIGWAGEFKYRPQLTGAFVKWKRVGSFGPWVQEFGGVS